MKAVNMHEAKTQLSRLVERAAKGEPFAIAKAGKPLVKVAALDVPAEPRRLGFLKGEIEVPDDFDRMGESEIAALFGAGR
ncbi:MAG TPA: type II toxin-antitoxin system prevent-host-death family antitoxin [Thermoanaerobaculia bacterium]|jgi:prevent-host-death family protein|nr:type II toxin-antitoxin system prevent-host-death family antitoxin [Thermoanaerobaculia bacterium]